MMGQRSGKQDRLFYSFNLDDHVPADHMLRSIVRYLDLADLRQHLEAYYSHTGRPSVDPELMIRMLLVGYCFGIRSERRLCDEVHLNLAYRWFCRLGLEDKVPDHSSYSKDRHGKRIKPHVPVRDHTQRTDETFPNSEFKWDEHRLADVYCIINKYLGVQMLATRPTIQEAPAQFAERIPRC